MSVSLAVLDDPVELNRFTVWRSGTGGLAESSLQLSGLHCGACAANIERALSGLPGVRSVSVNSAAARATVQWDAAQTAPSIWVQTLRAAGYDAVPDAAAMARTMRRREARQALWRLFVAAFCSMQVMMLATPSYVAAAGELTDEMRTLLNWGMWLLSMPVMLFSAGPYFSGAWGALRHRRIAMDVPVALGILITFCASTYSTFEPHGALGHDVYFDSLTMFVAFLLGGRWFELRARHAAAEELEKASAAMPQTAWRLESDGGVRAVSLHALNVGDRLRVPLGAAFPADGVIVEGSTQVDESLLTGESQPVSKDDGDTVIAGSINRGAPVLMRADRLGSDTRIEAVVAMMRNAMSQRPRATLTADRWAGPFLWLVLLLALGAGLAWWWIEPRRALWVVVSVLIVTCPCALSLAVPATWVAAARGLARHGVMLKRLEALETLAQISQVFVDKTGTLTEDRMGFSQFHWCAADAPTETKLQAAWSAAIGLAAWSTHPLSRALLQQAIEQALRGTTLSQVKEWPGQGVSGLDDQGCEWRMGSRRWLADGTLPADIDAQVWLSRDGQPIAAFSFSEVLRPGAAQAISHLREQGLKVTLLTGDDARHAQAMADRVGFDAVLAAVTPQGKLDAVRAAQQAGARVAMVGDGINDGPVLAQADVSLAMGQGALMARHQADAVVSSNRLGDVVRARITARRTVGIVKQNLIWAVGYNVLAIPMALAGALPPWAAGLGMATSSLVVVLNALRAAR